MKILPVTPNVNNNTKFKAHIKPTESLNGGLNLVKKKVTSENLNDLNFVKEVLDSLARISDSKKVSVFSINIDKRRPSYIYSNINGQRVNGGPKEILSNINEDLLVTEDIKHYAEKLEPIEPSILDFLKAEAEEAQRKFNEAKERYSRQLQAEFEQLRQYIFRDI